MYCGKRYCNAGMCACGRCDGVCGPFNGCPCPACEDLMSKTVEHFAPRCAMKHAICFVSIGSVITTANSTERYVICSICRDANKHVYSRVGVCFVCNKAFCLKCIANADPDRFQRALVAASFTVSQSPVEKLRAEIASFSIHAGNRLVWFHRFVANDYRIRCSSKACSDRKPCGHCTNTMVRFCTLSGMRCPTNHTLTFALIGTPTDERCVCDICSTPCHDPNGFCFVCQTCHFSTCMFCLFRLTPNWKDLMSMAADAVPMAESPILAPATITERKRKLKVVSSPPITTKI